jgi:hypothetical protein
MLRLDQSLEDALYEIANAMDWQSKEGAALLLVAGVAEDDVAGTLLEILGLPPDDAARFARQRAQAVGPQEFRKAVTGLVQLLEERGVSLGPHHVKTLMLA